MSDMKRKVFSADGTGRQGAAKDSLMLMITGTIGGGTLTVERYSEAAGDFVVVATYTAVLTDADEIKIGSGGLFRFQLTGATSPSLTLDYWFI